MIQPRGTSAKQSNIFTQGYLIPDSKVQYANIDPDFLSYKDTLTSTERRIHQAANFIDDPKPNISETKDSQMKVLENFADFKKEEQQALEPKKEQSILGLESKADSNFKANHFVPTVTTTETYRNVMQAADLLQRSMPKLSVTSTDFDLKVLYPYSKAESKKERPVKKCWMEHRKVKSKFVDVDAPTRSGFNKFWDE